MKRETKGKPPQFKPGRKSRAERIADRLFCDSSTRLVLERDSQSTGAGWCKAAVIDVINEELRQLPAKKRRKG